MKAEGVIPKGEDFEDVQRRVEQVCPICVGHGIVHQGFYDYPAGSTFGATSTGFESCRRCDGTGTITVDI